MSKWKIIISIIAIFVVVLSMFAFWYHSFLLGLVIIVVGLVPLGLISLILHDDYRIRDEAEWWEWHSL